ncbi:MAG: NAD-dependent epimerase/dehydratase family protein [Pseudomonadota bacterium]
MTPPPSHAPIAVVGGCGFIGSNLADSLMASGDTVVVIDNLSRPGVAQNLDWLRRKHRTRLISHVADIRDAATLAPLLNNVRAVFHLAAQTAVTTSLNDPVEDFSINAAGTLNLLETVRQSGRRVPFIFASTNKVYGDLTHATVKIGDDHVPADPALAAYGFDESQPLSFCTPYGCSKGVADQYVLDYGKTYGLPTIVMRMSCIYGPRQFGTEDQGWVAHFLRRALARESITVFGDGRQVRDILHVSDAVSAYRRALALIDRLEPRAFNLGGGPANAVNLLQVLQEASRITGRRIDIRFSEGRTGDQPYFVADTRSITAELGWRANIGWRDGLKDLADWLRRSRLARRRAEERYVA